MTRAMTYDEIADLFGITRKSAERLVKRKRWMRWKGNDGKARIDVPEEVLLAPPIAPADDPHGAATDPPHGSDTALILTRMIERQEAELIDLRLKAAERDVLTAQVEALRSILEVEKRHATARIEALRELLDDAKRREADLTADRDRWIAYIEKPASIVIERRGWWPWRRTA